MFIYINMYSFFTMQRELDEVLGSAMPGPPKVTRTSYQEPQSHPPTPCFSHSYDSPLLHLHSHHFPSSTVACSPDSWLSPPSDRAVEALGQLGAALRRCTGTTHCH